ncbi:MAG: flagellar protein FlaG [Pseudohongiellaceae bacterium]
MSTLNVSSVSETVKPAKSAEAIPAPKVPELSTSKRDISESTAEVAANLSEQKILSAESIEKLRDQLERTIESINVDLKLSETNLSFAVDKVSDRVLVSVVNEDTGETVRQVPAEAILKVAHNIEALKGILFDDMY